MVIQGPSPPPPIPLGLAVLCSVPAGEGTKWTGDTAGGWGPGCGGPHGTPADIPASQLSERTRTCGPAAEEESQKCS